MNIQEQLIGLCRDMIRLRGDASRDANAERDQVREKIGYPDLSVFQALKPASVIST